MHPSFNLHSNVGSPILSTTTKRKKTVKETSTIESDADSGQDSQNVYIKEEFNCSSDNDEPFDIISAVGTWMPLFKVVLPGSKSKKYIVKTNSVSDIINKTKVKFSLPDDEYKLVLEDSNCEIEDDDILLEYAKEYAIQNKSPMTLTLMPQWWNAVASTSAFNYNQESTPFIPQTQTQSFPGMKLDQQAINLENVWNKVPKRLLAACQNKKQPLPIDRLTMVRYIVDYMMFELKSTTRHTAETIAKMICTAYPESFADTIDGQIIGKGMENLRQQIYNAVKYRKKSRQDQNFMKKAADESDDKASEKKKSYYQDKQYGCVSYAPSLPRNETEKSQEQKRIRLLQLYMAGQKNNIFEISKLMLETYATQRARINDDDRCLSLIFHDWPFLKDSEYLTKHSSILLGNDIPKTWQESLEIKFTQIRKFFSRKENFKGKEEQVANIMKEAEKACSTSKNSNQETLMMFPLIVLQFAESQDKLYQIVKGKIEDVDLINDSNLELNHPVLIIRGKSLYDEKAICSVLTEKQLISCTDALDGILVTFLCYYVFGYYYPKEVARTLEFLQRVILGINPTKGSKKIAKGRSTERSFDSMVFKFAKQLNDFKN